MSWGGRRAGAGRKREPRLPGDEWGRRRLTADLSDRIASEANGPGGLQRRVVLALAARQATVAEIGAALGLPTDEVVSKFEKQLHNAKAVARLNALCLINAKAEKGNIQALFWLLRATERALKED